MLLSVGNGGCNSCRSHWMTSERWLDCFPKSIARTAATIADHIGGLACRPEPLLLPRKAHKRTIIAILLQGAGGQSSGPGEERSLAIVFVMFAEVLSWVRGVAYCGLGEVLTKIIVKPTHEPQGFLSMGRRGDFHKKPCQTF